MAYKYLLTDDIVESGNYPLTRGQLRGLLLMRNENGLDIAVRKIGKRLWIREDLFEKWIEEQEVTNEHT